MFYLLINIFKWRKSKRTRRYAWLGTNTHSEKQLKVVGGFYYSFVYLYFLIFFKEYFYNNKKEIKGADFAFKYFHLDLRIVGIKITLLFGSQNI